MSAGMVRARKYPPDAPMPCIRRHIRKNVMEVEKTDITAPAMNTSMEMISTRYMMRNQ